VIKLQCENYIIKLHYKTDTKKKSLSLTSSRLLLHISDTLIEYLSLYFVAFCLFNNANLLVCTVSIVPVPKIIF